MHDSGDAAEGTEVQETKWSTDGKINVSCANQPLRPRLGRMQTDGDSRSSGDTLRRRNGRVSAVKAQLELTRRHTRLDDV